MYRSPKEGKRPTFVDCRPETWPIFPEGDVPRRWRWLLAMEDNQIIRRRACLHVHRPALYWDNRLAGFGRTILAQQNFEGPHMCLRRAQSSGTTGEYPRRIAARDWRERARVQGPKFRVFGTSNHELRIAPFSHVSRFTRHSLWRWRIFSIMLAHIIHDGSSRIRVVAKRDGRAEPRGREASLNRMSAD